MDVKVNEANLALAKVRNGLTLARMALSQLCGTPLDKPMTLADEDRDNFNVSLRPASFDMRDVYENRYDFKALQLGAKMFEEKAKVARSEMLSTIAAIGGVYTTNPNVFNGFKHRFDFSYSIGAVVKIPIWHWGGLSNKYKAAVVDAKIKDLEIEDAKEKIDSEIDVMMCDVYLSKVTENLKY